MFNKETEYALRALVYIKVQNLDGRRPGSTEIAKETDAPHFFISKILQRLVRSGFLKSAKGKGGGFYFNEKEADFSIMDLISATGSGWQESSCGFGLKMCDEKNPCPLHERYTPIRNAMNRMVSEETISSLAKKVHAQNPKAKNKPEANNLKQVSEA